MTAGRVAYTTYSDLGGRRVDLTEVCEELGRLPLDAVLGVLARLSASCLVEDFQDVRWQGPALAGAIADNFPAPLRGARPKCMLRDGYR